MNFGLVALALLLVCASALAIGLIAGAPHPAYVDSYGNTTESQTNITQGNITAAAAPTTSMAGGVVIVIGFFVLVIAGIFLYGTFGKNRGGYSSRR